MLLTTICTCVSVHFMLAAIFRVCVCVYMCAVWQRLRQIIISRTRVCVSVQVSGVRDMHKVRHKLFKLIKNVFKNLLLIFDTCTHVCRHHQPSPPSSSSPLSSSSKCYILECNNANFMQPSIAVHQIVVYVNYCTYESEWCLWSVCRAHHTIAK